MICAKISSKSVEVYLIDKEKLVEKKHTTMDPVLQDYEDSQGFPYMTLL